jgi:hypothetical protein
MYMRQCRAGDTRNMRGWDSHYNRRTIRVGCQGCANCCCLRFNGSYLDDVYLHQEEMAAWLFMACNRFNVAGCSMD